MIKKCFLVIAIAAFILGGCGLSKEQIGETVKASMQQTFDTDAQFKDWHLAVNEVQILKQGDNQYQGLAKITYKGESHDVPVEVTADGKNVMWQVRPGGFAFVAQKELEKLQEIFR